MDSRTALAYARRMDKPPKRPIGFWIKRAEELITLRTNEAQRASGLSRLEWQLLSILHDAGTASREWLNEELRSSGTSEELTAAFERLAVRALLHSARGACSLSAEGRALHAQALALQMDVRRRATRGISEAEYQAAVSVLERLVHNLER